MILLTIASLDAKKSDVSVETPTVWSSFHRAAVPVFTLLRLPGQKLTNRNRNLNPIKGLFMSDFTVKHKFQLRMIIIPFHIRNVLSSPTETKLPPSSGRAAILMKEDTKHVKYNHVKIGKGFIGASKATAYRCLHACSLTSVQRTFWQRSTSERRSHILLASSCCRLPVKIFSKLTQVNLSLSLFQ